jgi:opacity protein-like surface antigen
MKKYLSAVIMVMALGYSTQAYAMDPYVGVGFGAFNIGTGVTKKTVSGGYIQLGDDFSENIGGEIRIGTSGSTGEELTLQSRAKVDYFAAVFLKPKYQINDAWMAYGLLGIATLKGSYSEVGLAKQTKTRTGYAYGAGVQYRFADQFAVGAELSHMLSKPKTNATAIRTNFNGLESSMFTINAKYYLY